MCCSNLTSITIPDSVTSIGGYAFEDCTRLTDVYYGGTEADRVNISIGEYNDNFTFATWYYNSCIGSANHTYDNELDSDCNICDATRVITGATGDCTWTLDGTVLTISGNGAMENYDYYSNNAPWGAEITKVIIEDGVTHIGDSAFEGCSTLISITIPEGVTSIGYAAFAMCAFETITLPNTITEIRGTTFFGCENLKRIDIPLGVAVIGSFAFAECDSLTNVVLPNSVIRIEDDAFTNCDNLKSITIPDSVKDIRSAFYGCSSLTSITIPNGVYRIFNYSFYGCSSLANITIPTSVTEIGSYAFDNCNSLTDVFYQSTKQQKERIFIEVDELNGETPSPITIATWHYNSCIGSANHTYDNELDPDCNICGKMRIVSYTVSNGEVTITDFDESFSGDLVIPETVNGYPVTKIANYAFYKCSGIESVTLPEGIKSIGDYAFSYCSSLKNINIPKSVKTIDANAFSQTAALENITVDANNTYFTAIDGVLFNKAKTELIAYPTAKADAVYTVPEGVTEIKANTFYYCENLTEVNLPSSITKIGNNAFYYCRRLKNIVIPETVNEIGNLAFFYCSALKSVTLPASVKSIGNSAFRNCPFLSNIYFAGSKADADKIIIGSNNTNLTSAEWSYCGDGSHIYSDNCDTECNICEFVRTAPHTYDDVCDKECNNCFAAREAEHAFNDDSDVDCNNCSKVRYLSYSTSNGNVIITKLDANFEGDLVIPETINGNPVTKIANYAFYMCSGVQSIAIPESVITIGDYAFSYCSSLKKINIPASVNTISDNAFSQINALENITVDANNTYFTAIDGVLFNKSVTELIKYPTAKADSVYTVPEGVTEIKANTFYYCENLTEVNLPSSLTKIGDSAFYYCRRLKNIVIPENVTEIGKLAFFYCSALKSVTLPAGIKSIGNSAFRSCPFLANVYYCGTKNQAMNISIGTNNNQLTFADWTYNYSYN